MNLKKIFFRKKYEEEQMKQEEMTNTNKTKNKTLEEKLIAKAHDHLKKYDESVAGYGINFSYGNFLYKKNIAAFVGNICFENSLKGYYTNESTVYTAIFAANIDSSTNEIKEFKECTIGIIHTPKIEARCHGVLSKFRGYKIKSITPENKIDFEKILAIEYKTNPTWNGPINSVSKIENYATSLEPNFLEVEK